MNKFLLLSIMTLLCAYGCNKSTSPSNPIIGAWELTNFFKNGSDVTVTYLNDFPGYTIYFADNGSVKSSYTNPATNNFQITFGVYEMMNDDTQVQVSFSGAAIQLADIHQLDDAVLKYGYKESGDSIVRWYKRR
jgi:hypothetical protein